MLLQKLTYGSTFCSVEHTHIENKDSFIVSFFSFKSKELEITNSEIYTDFNEAAANIPNGQHVNVIINNQKVLSKKIDGVHDTNKSVAIAFPNIKTSDFYFEISPQNNHSFISISRRIDVENILEIYKKNQLMVIGLSLGINSINTIIPHISDSKISTSNSEIFLTDKGIERIIKLESNVEKSFSINELKVRKLEILNFAGILAIITNVRFSTNNFSKKTNRLIEDFKQSRIFSIGLKTGLGVILTGLLINFVIFSNYNEKISFLLNEQTVNKNYKDQLFILNNELERNKSIVKEITSSTRSRVSQYIDDIGHSTPASIVLDQLYYQPIKKRIKPFEEVNIIKNTLTISGESKKSDSFSEWLSSLDQLNWVSKIEVLDYGFGSNSKTLFKLKISIIE